MHVPTEMKLNVFIKLNDKLNVCMRVFVPSCFFVERACLGACIYLCYEACWTVVSGVRLLRTPLGRMSRIVNFLDSVTRETMHETICHIWSYYPYLMLIMMWMMMMDGLIDVSVGVGRTRRASSSGETPTWMTRFPSM